MRMCVVATTLITVALASPAGAQIPSQPFVPFVVEKADADEIINVLNTLPMPRQQSDIILRWVYQLEQKAIRAKADADTKAAPK